jgi:SAM-dependent methyltransferase
MKQPIAPATDITSLSTSTPPSIEDGAGVHAGDRRVSYLSQPMPVNMGDWWFDIATVDHFWIRRRFHVMRRLADPVLRKAKRVADIGCGNGLLQRELEECYGISVTGFDLNEVALQKNVSRVSPLFCYNIHDRNPEFRAHFDVLLMFDVLEHIENEPEFLQSVKYHLAESGTLLINVPAHQFLRSDYDAAQGHFRRYSANRLTGVAEHNGFKVGALTYWGLPFVPLLLVRKTVKMRGEGGKAGFDSRGRTLNGLLSLLARCEPIPQRFLGTSVMAVLENRG